MKYTILLLCTGLLLGACQSEKQVAQEATEDENPTYQNPILAGFYPDPTICKAGDKFYMTNSTFSYFPGLPIFESSDLVNWKQIGHAMDRPSQLDTEGQGVSRGLFAPAITYHEGTFYIVCTQVDKGGNFVITATDPAGPWSDPIYLGELNGIDPSLFFDEDGRVYIVYNSVAPDNNPQYSGHRTIRMYELDSESLQPIGEQIMLVNGGVDISEEPVWIEAPHIYKIDGYYYLMCAEGGTAYNHSEVIFRSQDVRGPYEPGPVNPILTQRHLDPSRPNPVTTAGHADMVQLDNGDWWAVFLACRPYEDNYFNIGRETFLTPVKWEDGWPIINPDYEEVQYSYPTPMGNAVDTTLFPFNGNFTFQDEFDDDSLGLNYLLLRTPSEQWYEFTDGSLSMQLRPETASGLSNPSFVGHRQQHHTGNVSTALDFQPENENEKAGLLAFQSENHHYFLAKSTKGGQSVVQLLKSSEDGYTELASQPVSGEQLQLKITFDGADYGFHYAEDEGNWQVLQEKVDGKFLSTEVAGGFVGTMLAMYATSSGSDSDTSASFEWFRYEGNDPVLSSR
ncbi:glycoside hydrolase family 43 protein [Catalinimonas sp. 4WD22]|uniref:glycoside hydrolase family 43 protein n=1 Tax=Catalinimonas locisalis TaxID=3133978 RepID=UPI003100E6B1